MSNNKQSSVEWLIEQVINNNGVNKSTFEQAKAMHKEEIEKVSEDWWNEGASYMYDGQRKYNSFEQYYNETFGGNNDKKQNS